VLIDEATIFCRAGQGGHGCLSFRREKFVPKGGPDGGDGGRGGDVILVGDGHLDTLEPLKHRPHRRAKNGQPGRGKSMHGADGEDCLVPVPLGTLVYNRDTGEPLGDITEPDQRLTVARGGTGGYGNEHFKSATHQTPRETTDGEPGEEVTLDLRLKIIADVGLIGLPNAGKSTLLRAVSRARPKVAAYPFTTLQPHLGLADLPGDRRLVFADIPGLIAGAADGAGLGHAFLRHIERTRVLLHVLEMNTAEDTRSESIAQRYAAIRRELSAYAQALIDKPEIIAINKMDLQPDADRDAVVQQVKCDLALPDETAVLAVSGATGEGIRALLEACWSAAGHSYTDRGWREASTPRSAG